MKKIDMGYKNLSPSTFSFDEAQEIAREVWDAYGATAFSAPSGNMLMELANLAASKAIAREKGGECKHCGGSGISNISDPCICQYGTKGGAA